MVLVGVLERLQNFSQNFMSVCLQKGGAFQISQNVHEKGPREQIWAVNRAFFLILGNSSSDQADYDSGRDLALNGTLEKILVFLLRWLLSGSGQMLQLQIHDFSGLAFLCVGLFQRDYSPNSPNQEWLLLQIKKVHFNF